MDENGPNTNKQALFAWQCSVYLHAAVLADRRLGNLDLFAFFHPPSHEDTSCEKKLLVSWKPNLRSYCAHVIPGAPMSMFLPSLHILPTSLAVALRPYFGHKTSWFCSRGSVSGSSVSCYRSTCLPPGRFADCSDIARLEMD